MDLREESTIGFHAYEEVLRKEEREKKIYRKKIRNIKKKDKKTIKNWNVGLIIIIIISGSGHHHHHHYHVLTVLQSGKLVNAKNDIVENNLDLLGKSEVRWKGNKTDVKRRFLV